MREKLKNWLLENAIVKWHIRVLDKIRPPGFEGMSVYKLLKFLIQSFGEGNYSTRGAAISFYLILAIFPLLLVLLALIPYVPIEGFQADVLLEIDHVLPEAIHDQLLPIVEDLILEKHYVVLSIGFVLTIYYASSSIDAILKSFNSSYQIELKRNPIKRRLISLLLSLTWALFLLGAIVLMVLGEHFIAQAQEYFGGNPAVFSFLGQGIQWIVVFLILVVGITFLYNFGNPETRRFKLFSAGASLASLVIILASAGFITYATNFASYNELYGSLGSFIVLLLWVNLCSRILLMGFELTTKVDLIKIQMAEEEEEVNQ